MSQAIRETNSKGKPVVVIVPDCDTETWGPLFIGLDRARAVVAHVDAIKAFITETETQAQTQDVPQVEE